MMEIRLPCGAIALIDDEDAALADLKWRVWVRPGGSVYVKRSATKANPHQLLHRAVMKPEAGLVVDHINGDTLDNRRANLRAVAHRTNSHNIVGQGGKASHGIIGVTWNKTRWQAQIRVDGRLQHLGVFDDFEAAREARRAAEIRLWGVEPRREAELSWNR